MVEESLRVDLAEAREELDDVRLGHPPRALRRERGRSERGRARGFRAACRTRLPTNRVVPAEVDAVLTVRPVTSAAGTELSTARRCAPGSSATSATARRCAAGSPGESSAGRFIAPSCRSFFESSLWRMSADAPSAEAPAGSGASRGMMRSVFARPKENAAPEPDEKPKSEPEPPAAAAPADEPAQEPGGPDASLGMMRSVFARLKAKPAQPDEPAPEPPADATAEAEPARGDAEDAQSLGMLRSMFARLKMKDGRTPHEAEAARPKLLPSFDMAAVAALLREGRAKRVIVMCGAGISVSAGIPDFRTPGTGLYDNLQKYQPRTRKRSSRSTTSASTRAFYQLAREMGRGSTDRRRRTLSSGSCTRRALLRCFTQNIDSLESSAGLPREMVVAAHGNFDGATCVETGLPVPIAECRDAIAAGEPGWRALAERYGGLSPDIVFFGENLPRRFFVRAAEDFPKRTCCS